MTTKSTPTYDRNLVDIPTEAISFGLNVRVDADADPDLIASVKQVGILQPPTVTATATGYEVVFGHRRVLAARAAKLTSIPALVISTELAEDARLVDQLTENERRQNLTDAERAGGYQKLQLFGLGPDQIVDRVRVSRAHVDAALKITDNAAATTALAEPEISLEQAAAIAEFDGDDKTVKKLIDMAKTSPTNFNHTVRSEQAIREKNIKAAEIKAKLVKDGTAIVTSAVINYGKPGAQLTELADANGKPITKTAHRKCPGHAAYIDQSYWSPTVEAVYVCTDWDANGHQRRGRQVVSDEQREARIAAAAERDRIIAAEKTATTLRREFLVELVQRHNIELPGLDTFIARASFGEVGQRTSSYELQGLLRTIALPILGLTDTKGETSFTTIYRALESGAITPRAALLAGTAARYELILDWLHNDQLISAVVSYFNHLSAWGYNVSDFEKQWLTDLQEPEVGGPEDDLDYEPDTTDDQDDDVDVPA